MLAVSRNHKKNWWVKSATLHLSDDSDGSTGSPQAMWTKWTKWTGWTLKLTIDEVRFSIGKNTDRHGRAQTRTDEVDKNSMG
jgi:hypothetical protein